MKLKYLFPATKNKARTTDCFFFLILCLCFCCIASCKKLTEVQAPVTELTSNNVYTSDASAIAVMTAIYADISGSAVDGPGAITSLSIYAGFSADELSPSAAPSALTTAYYTNSLSATAVAAFGTEYWVIFYHSIYRCNDVIQGVNSSSSLSPAIKNQLLGEAEFMRAYFYFYLVNLYGDVPLTLTTDYKTNAVMARAPKVKVYQQIITDLLDAQQKLSANYLDGSLLNISTDRVRPTKWAATALLARAYLYYGSLPEVDAVNYNKAEQQATSLIENSGGIFALSTLSNAFLRASLGNNEAIWQLQPVIGAVQTNTPDGSAFIPPAGSPPKIVSLNKTLVRNFETGDNRRTNWIDSTTVLGITYYYPFKYKVGDANMGANPPVTEHEMMLRLGEQYLIRAEARAQQGNIAGAQADLNAIRSRAGLPNTIASDKAALLAAILHERQVELFTEMGHRWLDLKRTGTIDAVMGTPGGACAAKGGTWNSYQQLYPLLSADIQLDPNIKQNPGY